MEATGGTSEETKTEVKNQLPTMAERLMSDLKEDCWPTEDSCKRVMGLAHLGVVPLP